jgi:WD40 repeat protein
MRRSFKFVTCVIVIVLGLTALSACASTTGRNIPDRTIVYRVWPQIGGQLQSLYRIDADGQNKTALIENSTQLNLMQSITFHNYFTPQSLNAKYFTFYSLNASSQWGLNLFDITSGATQSVYAKDLEPQLVRFREGFSPDNQYYAYTYRNKDTGFFFVSVINLSPLSTLPDLENAYFVDFTADSKGLVYLGVGDAGSVTGIFKMSLPDEKVTTLYTPPTGEEITYVTLSPDGKWLLFTDQSTMSLYRIPAEGGTKQTVYKFSGTTMSVNYEPYGNYLAVVDESSEKRTLELFDSTFNKVLELDLQGPVYFAFSQDGKQLAYLNPEQAVMDLNVVTLGNSTSTTVDNTALFYQPEFSADSTHLLYIRYSERTSNYGELVLAKMDGSSSTVIDSSATSYLLRSDGTIVYMHYDADSFQSTLMKVDKDGLNQIVLDGPFSGMASVIK